MSASLSVTLRKVIPFSLISNAKSNTYLKGNQNVKVKFCYQREEYTSDIC